MHAFFRFFSSRDWLRLAFAMIQPLARRDSEAISQAKMAIPAARQPMPNLSEPQDPASLKGIESSGIVPERCSKVPQGMLKNVCMAVLPHGSNAIIRFITGGDLRFEVREARGLAKVFGHNL